MLKKKQPTRTMRVIYVVLGLVGDECFDLKAVLFHIS